MNQQRIIIQVIITLLVALLPCAGGANVCSNPGKDGVGSITGIRNTYYPGSGSSSAGSMSVTVGTLDGRGAATAVAAGDLIMVMQMQDADINATNTSSYGGSLPGSGYTSLNNAGVYEYAVVASVAGSTLTLVTPLQNSYRTAAATGSAGQRTFQVIRIPQYSSAALAGLTTAPPWNGSTGGIVAFDVAGNLAWGNQTIDVTGRGFRGGAGIGMAGSTTAGQASTDYITPAPVPPMPPAATTGANRANGIKGEGVAGTPRYLFTSTTDGPTINGTGAITDSGVDGYPGGSFARGAPGNAGGGGTDGNIPANDQNTGGGGGGAYSVGGMGGYGWTPGTPPGSKSGGFGGYSIPMAPGLLTMGGGGGAGSTNNNTGTPAAGLASSGAAGGGVVIVRARTVSGTGTITANGTSANNTVLNDASGGGGAGGTILVFASNNSGSLGTLTVNSRGGNGGTNTGSGSPHGPGGGGSGGFVALTSASGVTINVQAGANGTTATSATSTSEYGSTASSGGYQIYTLQPTDIPGAGSNALCSPQLTVTKTTSKADTVQGGSTAYILTVRNQSGYGTATGVSVSDLLPGTPSPFTYVSTDSVTLSGGATRTVTSNPAAGATAPAWGTFSIPGGGAVAIRFTVAVPVGTTAGTYQNPGSVIYDDPTRSAAGQTVTPGGAYAGGGTVPGTNYLSSSSTLEDVNVWAPATVLKSFNPVGITAGSPSLLSLVITNPNPVPLTGAAMTDTYPAGLVNTGTPAGAISGTGCAGTVTALAGGTGVSLANGTIPASGSCTITANVTFATAGSYTNTIPAGALANNRNVTNTAPATATLNQLAVQPPAVTKTFLPSQIQQGAVATVSFTLINGGTTGLTGVAFTDNLTNMLVAATPAVTTTCGGAVTATAGAAVISLANGSIAAGSSCTVTAQVTSNVISTAGGHANTATGITSTQSGAGPNSNTANLVVAGTPTIAKAFVPASIAPGATSTLTFTLTNPGNIALTNATFSDTLTNMQIAATGAAGGTCFGASGNTLNAGLTNLIISGLTLPAAGSCTVTVPVTSSVPGAQANIANGVTSSETPAPGNPSPAATLTVLYPPQIAKSFAPGVIQSGATSTLTFAISNPNGATALSNVSFTDPLVNMQINATGTAGGTCAGAGSNSFIAGQTSLSFSGITVNAAASCTVTVAVTSSTQSPAGGHPNTVGGATSTQTGTAVPGAPDTAYLTVLLPPTVAKAFSPPAIAVNGTSTIIFTLTNPNALVLTGGVFSDTFPTAPGQMRLTNAAQTFIGGGRGTCSGSIPSANAAANQLTAITLNGITILANSSCTIMVDVTDATAGNYSNTTSGVSTFQTPTAGAVSNAATLSVGRLGLGKAFIPATVGTATNSTLTFTLSNPSATAQTGANFTDTYPTGLINGTPLTVGGTCTGVTVDVATLAGGTAFNVTAANIPASGSCTITVPVKSATAGSYTNTTATGVASTQTATRGPVSNATTLTVVNMPTIAETFSPSVIDVYGTSTLTFTLTNSNSATLSSANFTDTLTGFSVASPPILGGSCAGVVSAPSLVAGATSLNLTVPNLLPGSCTITIPVTASATGSYTNTTSGITTTQTGATVGSPSNTATLTVNRQALQVSKTPNVFTATPGTLVDYDIGYSNPNVTTPLQNVAITDPVPIYTSYQSASCGPLPPGVTSCNVSFTPAPAGNGNGLVTWSLGGALNAGSSGMVRLTVRIQ